MKRILASCVLGRRILRSCILSVLAVLFPVLSAASTGAVEEGLVDESPWAVDIEILNRRLFRSRIIDADQVALQLGVTRSLSPLWSLRAQIANARGSGAVGLESQAALLRRFQVFGVDVSGHLEYIRWHHSDYELMALVGFSVNQNGMRLLGKQDMSEDGGHHLEVNVRVLKQHKSTVALALVDTTSPLQRIQTTLSIPNLDDPENPTVTVSESLVSLKMQYISLQTFYDVSNKFRIFGHYYKHLKGDSEAQTDEPGATWAVGVRWYWHL